MTETLARQMRVDEAGIAQRKALRGFGADDLEFAFEACLHTLVWELGGIGGTHRGGLSVGVA